MAKVKISAYFQREEYHKIKKMHEKTGRTMSDIVQEATNKYIRELENELCQKKQKI